MAGMNSGKPSAAIRTLHPEEWISRWCTEHSITRLQIHYECVHRLLRNEGGAPASCGQWARTLVETVLVVGLDRSRPPRTQLVCHYTTVLRMITQEITRNALESVHVGGRGSVEVGASAESFGHKLPRRVDRAFDQFVSEGRRSPTTTQLYRLNLQPWGHAGPAPCAATAPPPWPCGRDGPAAATCTATTGPATRRRGPRRAGTTTAIGCRAGGQRVRGRLPAHRRSIGRLLPTVRRWIRAGRDLQQPSARGGRLAGLRRGPARADRRAVTVADQAAQVSRYGSPGR
jgi:hypothetical protein